MTQSNKSLMQSGSGTFQKMRRSKRYYESPAGKWIMKALKKYGHTKSDREILNMALREKPGIFGSLYHESTRRNISATRHLLNIPDTTNNSMNESDYNIITEFIDKAGQYDTDNEIAKLILKSGKLNRQVKLETLRRRICYLRAERGKTTARAMMMKRLTDMVRKVCERYPNETTQFKASRLQLMAGISDSYAHRLCSRYSKFKTI